MVKGGVVRALATGAEREGGLSKAEADFGEVGMDEVEGNVRMVRLMRGK